MTVLRRLCGTLWDITYDNPKKVLWNTMGFDSPGTGTRFSETLQDIYVEHYRTYLMTALRRLCGTLWDITYDSPKRALWNTMGHNL